jgi:histidyl-tRNA synthetase
MSKPKPQILSGFRDFPPQEMAFQKWFYSIVSSISESFGFQEYEGPILETLDLYAAKSGEELVKRQSFTFFDRSGKEVALRPEMTPSLARMIAEHSGSLTFPIKWYTYGRRYRYEKPQRGRGREFFQWDIDMLGPDNLEADAEIICIAATAFQRFGLSPNEVVIKVNDRRFMQQKLSSFKIPNSKYLNLLKIIDKKEKVEEKDFIQMLKEQQLNNKQIDSVQGLLNNLNSYQESAWLTGIENIVKKYGLTGYVVFDPSIVRGLDYYTRTVFEGWDVKGEFRSIWGGGRYDNLTSDVGGKKRIPGVGFAMGDMVITEVLKDNKKLPKLQPKIAPILVTTFSPELFDQSLDLSLTIRSNTINVELFPEPSVKLEKQLKYADIKGIPFVIIVGPDEVARNVVTLKDLRSRSQFTVAREKLIETLRSVIKTPTNDQ